MIAVVSTVRPALFRSPTTGRLCLAGGSVMLVNGVKPTSDYPEVPEGTVPADIQWQPSVVVPKATKVQTFEVQGRSGTYTVTVGGPRPTCTCPGYTFRRTCKHVKQVAR